MNAASRCASWASIPIDRSRFRVTRPASASSSPAAILSSVVLPAPFGPTRPTRSPSASAASIRSRITNVPISRWTPSRRRIDIRRPAFDGARRLARAPPTLERPRAGSPPRAASVRRARPARRGGSSRSACRASRRRHRSPSSAGRVGSRVAGSAVIAAGVARRPASAPCRAGSPPRRARSPDGSRWHHEQKCVERAPMTIRRIGRPQRKQGSPARW